MASQPGFLVPPALRPVRGALSRPAWADRPDRVGRTDRRLTPKATAAAPSPADRPRERGRPTDRRGINRRHRAGASAPPARRASRTPPATRGGGAAGAGGGAAAAAAAAKSDGKTVAPPLGDLIVGGGVAVAGLMAATVLGSAVEAVNSLPAVGESLELVCCGRSC